MVYISPKLYNNNPLKPSLEFYYIGWDELFNTNVNISIMNDTIMTKMNTTSSRNLFNWTILELLLNDTASRYSHAILRFYIHFPGRPPLRLPKFLLNNNVVSMTSVEVDSDPQRYEQSPQYNDPILLQLIKRFISEFGKLYDNDKRICAIQLGLLGFYGEWHSNDPTYSLIPIHIQEQVVSWYSNAFSKTQLQIRYVTPKLAYEKNFGRHDDSFAYYTIASSINNNNNNEPTYKNTNFYFWPRTIMANQTDFWKYGIMGGETRPQIQSNVFQYQLFPNHQDYMDCIETTHATYMLHHNAYINGGYKGNELNNAIYANNRMGFNYRIVRIVASTSNNERSNKVDMLNIDVDIQQMGVAPFYYPLSIGFECPLSDTKYNLERIYGVDKIINNGEVKTFTFYNISYNPICFQQITFNLKSPYLYTMIIVQ